MSEESTINDAANGENVAHTHGLDAFLGATPRRHRRQMVSLVVLVLALIALAALFVRFVAGSSNPYYVSPIETGDFVPQLSETGVIHGQDELPIHSRLEGQVSELPVHSGAKVRYGDVLARIESPGLDQNLAAEKAGVQSAHDDRDAAQVTLREATSRLARFNKVWRESDHRVPSSGEMEHARADARRARADYDAADTRLKAAQLHLQAEQTRAKGRVIRAPFEGTVFIQGISEGMAVRPDMPLFTLVRPGTPLGISVPLASRTAMRLQPGAKARIQLEERPEIEQEATLTRIDTRDGQRIAHFKLTKPAREIQPGMRARVEVALAARHNVLLVPDAALDFSPEDEAPGHEGRNAIYLVGKDGNPRRVFVSVGGSDGGRTEVFASQLHAGQDVIIGWREAPETTN